MIVAGSKMPFPPTFLSRRRVEAQTRAGKPCADSGQVIRDVDIHKHGRTGCGCRIGLLLTRPMAWAGRLDGQVWTARDRTLEVSDTGPGATSVTLSSDVPPLMRPGPDHQMCNDDCAFLADFGAGAGRLGWPK